MKNAALCDHINAKFSLGELPHFIIYEHYKESNIDNAILKITGLSSLNHNDLLVIRPIDGNYKVDDGNLLLMSKFLSHKPLTETKKWVILTATEVFSPVILNKLLKTLEEPPSFAQIIFFHEKGAPLLTTIRSRGITFRESEPIVQTNHPSKLYSLHNSEAYSLAKEFNEEEEKVYLEQMIGDITSFAHAHRFIEETKSMEKHRAFHQSSTHRLYRYIDMKNQK